MTDPAATDPRDPLVLEGAVRWLCATSVADAADVDRAAALLVAALLDLAAHERGDYDPRRQRTLELAERIQRAKDAGVGIPELAERFGKSEKTIYRLAILKTSRDIQPRESPAKTNGNRR